MAPVTDMLFSVVAYPNWSTCRPSPATKHAVLYPVGLSVLAKNTLDKSYAMELVDTGVPCIIVRLHAFANRKQYKHMLNTGVGQLPGAP